MRSVKGVVSGGLGQESWRQGASFLVYLQTGKNGHKHTGVAPNSGLRRKDGITRERNYKTVKRPLRQRLPGSHPVLHQL